MSKVNIGDKIRVVNPVMAWGVYSDGDIFEVESVEEDEDVKVVEHGHLLLREEFEVLPKHNKPWKKGDKVRNVRTGKVVEVYAYQPTHRTVGVRSVFVSHEKGFTFIENGREEWSHIEDFELIEEKGSEDMAKENGCDTIKMTMPDGTVIEGTAESLAEMQKLSEEQEEEEVEVEDVKEEESDPREKFSEGDKVRLLDGGGKFPLNKFTDGHTYEVIDPLSDEHSPTPTIEIKQEGGGGISGYAEAEQLEKIEEDKTSNHFNIGDKVRICVPGYSPTIYGRAGVPNGEIGTVKNIVGDKIKVKFPSYSDILLWDGHPSDLEVVGEADEIDLSFIRAGREPGEFVVGDIVEVTESRSGHYVGTIGEIVKVLSLGRGEVKAIKEGTYMEFREGNLKLIAPADKRVDIDA